jgi:plastocyanin
MDTPRRFQRPAAAAFAGCLALAACAGSPPVTSDPPPTPSPSATTSVPAPTLTASPTTAPTASPTEAGPLRVLMSAVAGASGFELFYQPRMIVVSAASPTLELFNQAINEGLVFHNMLIGDEVDGDALAASESVGAGESALFTFAEVPAGTYQIWCSIDDHFELGMVGTLTIEP